MARTAGSGQARAIATVVVAVALVVVLIHRHNANAKAKHRSAQQQPAAAASKAPPPAVPGVVGRNLQDAYDSLFGSGYRAVTSHDAAGRGRYQILYSNWRVCDQQPSPGESATKDTTVELGVVRTGEACPPAGHPTQPPSFAGGLMPDLSGRALNVVRGAFQDSASVSADDLRSHRVVLVDGNWQVCTQVPAPQRPFTGGTIRVGVVKFGESCP